MGILGWMTAVGLATWSAPTEPRVDLGDLSLEVAGRWQVVDHSDVRRELLARPEGEGRGDLLRVWSTPLGEGARARLVVSRRSCPLRVDAASRSDVERWIRESLGRRPGGPGAHVIEAHRDHVDGVAAWRVRVRVTRPHRPKATIDQVIYVIGGAATRVIGLSAPSERLDGLLGEFERTVRTARWSDRRPAPSPSIAWLGVALIGSMAGLGGTRRRQLTTPASGTG